MCTQIPYAPASEASQFKDSNGDGLIARLQQSTEMIKYVVRGVACCAKRDAATAEGNADEESRIQNGEPVSI